MRCEKASRSAFILASAYLKSGFASIYCKDCAVRRSFFALLRHRHALDYGCTGNTACPTTTSTSDHSDGSVPTGLMSRLRGQLIAPNFLIQVQLVSWSWRKSWNNPLPPASIRRDRYLHCVFRCPLFSFAWRTSKAGTSALLHHLRYGIELRHELHVETRSSPCGSCALLHTVLVA